MAYKNTLFSDDKLNIMEITLTKAIKWLILLISFIMFYIQAQIAVNSLRNPPIVDSTETLNIADVDPPLITFCPLNQFNETKLREFGYYENSGILMGYHNDEQFAWGAQYNLTFDELIDEVLTYHKDLFDLEIREGNQNTNPLYEKRFYPAYGYCIDISNYTGTEQIKLHVKFNESKTTNCFIKLMNPTA